VLDTASYPLLWGFFDETGVRPEYILPALHHESGFDPSRPNSAGYPYYGLNQVSGSYLASRGISPGDYLTWSASRQLREVVLPFLKAYANVRSATRLYQANFLPATLATAKSLSDVVSTRGDPYYAANAGLDANRNGVITVSDLASVMAKDAASSAVQHAIASAYAIRPGESPKDPVYGEDFGWFSRPYVVASAILIGGAAVAYGIHEGGLDAAWRALDRATLRWSEKLLDLF
jgi:hypothetical protein